MVLVIECLLCGTGTILMAFAYTLMNVYHKPGYDVLQSQFPSFTKLVCDKQKKPEHFPERGVPEILGKVAYASRGTQSMNHTKSHSQRNLSNTLIQLHFLTNFRL